MSRLLCLIALSLGLVQTAVADESDKISVYLSAKFGVAKEKAGQISEAVQTAAVKYSLSPTLLLAIISIESRFQEKAKGSHGATGLMQVVPAAHRGLLKNIKDLTDPDANIEAGSAILHGYIQAAGGDVNAALKSYGGSKAYAQKVSLRADSFQQAVGQAQDGQPAVTSATVCDGHEADRCAAPGNSADVFFIPAASSPAAALDGAAAIPSP